MSRFDDCFDIVVGNEGGYVNDKADHGGATKFGITESVAKASGYAGEMRNFPISQAKLIYASGYWKPCHCDLIGAPLDLVVFDTAINCGAHAAVKMLQQALGVEADGAWGEETLHAVKTSHLAGAALMMLNIREQFYRKLADRDATQERFLRGWLNRVEALRDYVEGVKGHGA